MDRYFDNVCTYEYEGIKVSRIPIHKARPGGNFSSSVIIRQVNTIKTLLDNESFVPDIITGHFMNPSLEILVHLKKKFNVPVALSLHGKLTRQREIETKLLPNINYIGFRSNAIKESFERIYGHHSNSFLCPSGVPELFFRNQPYRNYKENLRIIYVGNLIKRKHPAAIASALSFLNNSRYTINYVGEGMEKDRIERIAKESNLVSRIMFTGRIPRSEVCIQLDSADIFVMISENETFGLVYLEAMARGCIVVASKGEGMDGIIKHGINGFLCEAGDVKMLANILDHIQCLTANALKKMSDNSIKTAKEYTDSNVAKQYLRGLKIE